MTPADHHPSLLCRKNWKISTLKLREQSSRYERMRLILARRRAPVPHIINSPDRRHIRHRLPHLYRNAHVIINTTPHACWLLPYIRYAGLTCNNSLYSPRPLMKKRKYNVPSSAWCCRTKMLKVLKTALSGGLIDRASKRSAGKRISWGKRHRCAN